MHKAQSLLHLHLLCQYFVLIYVYNVFEVCVCNASEVGLILANFNMNTMLIFNIQKTITPPCEHVPFNNMFWNTWMIAKKSQSSFYFSENFVINTPINLVTCSYLLFWLVYKGKYSCWQSSLCFPHSASTLQSICMLLLFWSIDHGPTCQVYLFQLQLHKQWGGVERDKCGRKYRRGWSKCSAFVEPAPHLKL